MEKYGIGQPDGVRVAATIAELVLSGVVSQLMQRSDPSTTSLPAWIDALQARGRYTFSRDEAASAIGRGDLGLTKSLRRLALDRRIVSPRRGFYVVVPPEFRFPGSPPATWFVDDLMRFIGRQYYVGVLSAAALHGAAHQQPQQFQVVSEVPLRPVSVGRVRIRFVGKSGIEGSAVKRVNTPTGTMAVSTPEQTALDLVRYYDVAGSLSNVATVLMELAEEMDPNRVVEVAEASQVEISVVQRLGYLLDLVEMEHLTKALSTWLDERTPRLVPLRPERSPRECPIDRRWRIRVNEEVEPDL